MSRLLLCLGLTFFLAGCGSESELSTNSSNASPNSESKTSSATPSALNNSTTPEASPRPQPASNTSETPQVHLMDPAARQKQASYNLKQIMRAMENYLDTHNHFPPAIVIGPDGKPWHSWRVLLLPHLEQKALYDEYRLNEPWNSEHNMKVAETILEVYHDPVHDDPASKYTHYAAAVGADTVLTKIKFDGSEAGLMTALKDCSKMRDIQDGTSNTIVIGTITPADQILWTEPRDVDVDLDQFEFNAPGSFATPHKSTPDNETGKALFGMCDSSIQSLPATFSSAVTKTFFTKNGKEKTTFGKEL